MIWTGWDFFFDDPTRLWNPQCLFILLLRYCKHFTLNKFSFIKTWSSIIQYNFIYISSVYFIWKRVAIRPWLKDFKNNKKNYLCKFSHFDNENKSLNQTIQPKRLSTLLKSKRKRVLLLEQSQQKLIHLLFLEKWRTPKEDSVVFI